MAKNMGLEAQIKSLEDSEQNVVALVAEAEVNIRQLRVELRLCRTDPLNCFNMFNIVSLTVSVV